LLVLLWGADAGDCGAGCGSSTAMFLGGVAAGSPANGACVPASRSRNQGGRRGEYGFDALAIEPAGGFDGVGAVLMAVMWCR